LGRHWPDADGYIEWSLTWVDEAMRVLRPDGLLYCFGQLGKREHTFLHLMSEAVRRWGFHDLINWDRAEGYRERHLAAGRFATNLWRIPSLKRNFSEKCGHPAQKPVKLIERIVLSSSDPGALVVDPFLGFGTTAVVAEQLGRRWLGIEQSRIYLRMAQKRIKVKRAERKQAAEQSKTIEKWSGR